MQTQMVITHTCKLTHECINVHITLTSISLSACTLSTVRRTASLNLDTNSVKSEHRCLVKDLFNLDGCNSFKFCTMFWKRQLLDDL